MHGASVVTQEKKITRDQSLTLEHQHRLMYHVVTETPWKEIPRHIEEELNGLSPAERAHIFKELLTGDQLKVLLHSMRKNKVRFQALVVDRRVLLDPQVCIGADWVFAESQDERSLAHNRFEPQLFQFELCLRDGERYISGNERLVRLKENPSLIRLDAQVCLALLAEEGQRTLRAMKHHWMDFPGSVFCEKSSGKHYVMGVVWKRDHYARQMFPLTVGSTSSVRPSVVLPASPQERPHQ